VVVATVVVVTAVVVEVVAAVVPEVPDGVIRGEAFFPPPDEAQAR